MALHAAKFAMIEIIDRVCNLSFAIHTKCP